MFILTSEDSLSHKHYIRRVNHRADVHYSVSKCTQYALRCPCTVEIREVAMAKGQMRSNREKKKPKQDKNKKKGSEVPSAFKPGTTYTSQYSKKH